MKRLKYWFYLIIVRLYQTANSYVRLKELKKSAVFDDTVILSGAANLANAQGVKENIQIGKNSIIHGHLLIFGYGGRITIGENTFIGPSTNVWSSMEIRIGSYVLVSHNVNIIDNISHPKNHKERMKDWEYRRFIGFQRTKEFDLKDKAIIIKDNAWIGYGSSIHKGVTIGKGAIVGSDSVVTSDVPDFAIVVGAPAKIIGYTD